MQGDRIFMSDWRAIETDEQCSMKYWLANCEGGNGIARKADIIPNLILEQTHQDLKMLSLAENIEPDNVQLAIDEILSELSGDDREDYPKMEALYRRLGWMAAFAIFHEPQIRKNYETADIDTELVLDRNPLWIITHPDRVLKSRTTGDIIYREYVPMPRNMEKRKWLAQWSYNMRLHVGMAAANENLKIGDVSYGQVMGLSEGYVSSIDNRLIHPYVYGYYNNDTKEWSPPYKGKTDGNWVQTPVWKYPGGVVQWVTQCGKEVADSMFPISPAVTLNEENLDSWAITRLRREREIDTLRGFSLKQNLVRERHFPRRYSECRPMNGDVCPFLAACWGNKPDNLMLKDELYVPNFLENTQVVVGEVVA